MPAPLEVVAAAFGVAAVWLAARGHVLNWPAALVNVLLYAWIFWQARLYANAGLQVVYAALSVAGWIHWRGGGAPPPVTRTPRRAWWGLVATALLGTVAVRLALRATDAAAPWPDAALTGLSLVAQWQLMRKRADTWGWWIVVNLGYITFLGGQRLWATVAQYAVFLGIAVHGHRRWHRLAERA